MLYRQFSWANLNTILHNYLTCVQAYLEYTCQILLCSKDQCTIIGQNFTCKVGRTVHCSAIPIGRCTYQASSVYITQLNNTTVIDSCHQLFSSNIVQTASTIMMWYSDCMTNMSIVHSYLQFIFLYNVIHMGCTTVNLAHAVSVLLLTCGCPSISGFT